MLRTKASAAVARLGASGAMLAMSFLSNARVQAADCEVTDWAACHIQCYSACDTICKILKGSKYKCASVPQGAYANSCSVTGEQLSCGCVSVGCVKKFS